MRFIALIVLMLYTATPAYSKTMENNRPNFLRYDSDQTNKENVESERLDPHKNGILVSDDKTLEHTKVMGSIAKIISNIGSIILRDKLSSSDEATNMKCDGLGKQTCQDKGVCQWKDKECVPRCGKLDKDTCISEGKCFWDGSICKSKDKKPTPAPTKIPQKVKCDGFGKNKCNDQDLCKWKDSTCVPRCEKLDKATCISEGKCKWDGSKCQSKTSFEPVVVPEIQ